MNLRERILEKVPACGIEAKALMSHLTNEDAAMVDCVLGAMVRDKTLTLACGYYAPSAGRRASQTPFPGAPDAAASPSPGAQPKVPAGASAVPPRATPAGPGPKVSKAAVMLLEEMLASALARIQEHEGRLAELQLSVDRENAGIALARAQVALAEELLEHALADKAMRLARKGKRERLTC